MPEKIKYPKSIQSKPCGIDKFDGQSHKRLTDAITNHILQTDDNNSPQELSRIIGLEGSWGSGKSNIIKQLAEKLREKYYLFEYDAWGHQEDLQRRSFLELITDKLINEAGILDKKKWQSKLNDLLAKKVVRVNKTLPRFNAGALWTALLLSITPITVFIAERLETACAVNNVLHLVLIAFSPILMGIILWLFFMLFNKDMRSLSYLLKISKDESIETKNYETINEDEPTVIKFKAWMQDISDHIKANNKRKLIVIFDNMDRLPAEKVKELWSSIHTFFSEDGFENIWAIIPFDEKHLCSAFGESDTAVQLTKSFINKTFPIVYRVSPPVITDFKKIFNKLYEEAFSNTESEHQGEISRMFNFVNPSATVRDMIIFINQLVALKTIWEKEIDILYMAIFTLYKDKLLIEPVNQILSGLYLDTTVSKAIPDDEILQKKISALVYGIQPNDAEQIPISKYIENCLFLESSYDINKYANHKHFISILTDKVRTADILLDTLIKGLNNIDNEFEKQNKAVFLDLWDGIAKQKIGTPISKQELDDSFKILIKHTSSQYQKNIVSYLCKSFQEFEKFSGGHYYNSINDLKIFLQNNGVDLNICDFIVDFEKSPEIFVDYVVNAKDEYRIYKLKTDPENLDGHFSNLVPDKLINVDMLKYLKGDENYNFKKTVEKIENLIQQDKQAQLFKVDNFKSLMNTYKILNAETPLPVQLSEIQRNNLWTMFSQNKKPDEFLEILTIQIANGVTINIKIDKEQVDAIANNIDHYARYGDLLINNLSWNIPVLNQVLKYMTENKLGNNLSLEKILPKFFDIRSKLNISESILLEQLNRWNRRIASVNKENIQSVIPNAAFFEYSSVIENTLVDHLNKVIIEALSAVTTDDLYSYKADLNYYWFVLIDKMIDSRYLEVMPDNLIELGKKLVKDIASSALPIPKPNDLFDKIIKKLEKKDTAALTKEVRDEFCNGRFIINPQLFLYFEQWFEHQGELSSRCADVVRNILEPVITDKDCLGLIVSKPDYYAQLINAADDDATDIKKRIHELAQKNDDAKKFEAKIH